MKQLHAIAFSVAIMASNAALADAKTPDLARLDDFVQSVMVTHGIPGIGIVAVSGNHIVFERGYGTADGEHAFDQDTQFYVASNTKAFTGLALARLIAQGHVGLDDPITKYIPATFFLPEVEPEKVTIRDILAHTTGWANDALISRTAYTGEIPEDMRTLLKFTEFREDDHSRAFRYSNLGYLLAGMVVAKETGGTWQGGLKSLILEPAALVHTTTTAPGQDANTALPFEAGRKTPLDPRKTDSTMHAAGGIYSTLPDMGRWLELFTDPHQQRIPAADMALAQTSLVDGIDKTMGPFKMAGYGYGWIHGQVFDEELRFHFGSYPGYESMISYMPETNLGVFIYVNERQGGLRVAGALTALFYDVMRSSPELDAHQEMLAKMVDGVYSTPPSAGSPPATAEDFPGLCGTYVSPKYGTLNIQRADAGYTVRLGELHSQASRGEAADQFTVRWIPGQEEVFSIGRAGDVPTLQYGDYGKFTMSVRCTEHGSGDGNDR